MLIENDGPPVPYRRQRYRRIFGAQARAAKTGRILAIGLSSDKLTLGRAIPIISTTGVKESPRQAAEGQNQFTGIISLQGRARELKKELLERLRMRLQRGSGISLRNRQVAPSALSKRLKISQLCEKATLHSQIESSNKQGRGAYL